MKTKLILNAKVVIIAFAAMAFFVSGCSKTETGTPDMAGVTNGEKSIGPSESSNTIVHLPGLVHDIFRNPPTSEGSILYNPLTGTTLGGIDGHPITYGDYLKVSGQAEIKCTNRGTQLSLHLRNLFPNATYSMWVQIFQSPGYEGSFSNRTGYGAFGNMSGNNNTFKSSANGQGQVSLNLPEGTLSINGSAGNCLISDEFEYHIVGVYHIYGLTYGPVPGPQAYYVEHFRYIFTHHP